MKSVYKFFGILALCLLAGGAFSQSPSSFNYQALIRNASGNIMASQSVNMRFTIRTASASGSSQYMETQTLSTDQFGMLSHDVGTGTVVSGSFGNISWASGTKFLQVEADLGAGYVNLGAQQLVSVPFALEAKHATTANSATSATTATTATTSSDNRWSSIGNNINNVNSGNVGLGTTSPMHKLDVNGRINVEQGVLQRGGAAITNTTDLGLYCRVPGNWMRFVTSGADFRFFTLDDNGGKGTDGDAVFTIAGASGNIGMKTVSPGADLHIKQSIADFPNPTTGGIRLEESGSTEKWQIWNSSNFLSFAWEGTRVAYVNNSTGAWTTTSDRRFKKNVTDLAPVLERVMQLKPVEFNYNQHSDSDAKVTGFIAQDVQPLFPQVVSQEDKDAPLAISYADFGVISIKAIQEQQAQIEALKAEMAALKAELEAIRNK